MFIPKKYYLLIIIINNCLQASCSISTPNTSNITFKQLMEIRNADLKWHSHKNLVANINRYNTSGLFAYISKFKTFYARFYWQQINTDHYRLVLMDIIGNLKIDLHILPGLVQLIDCQGKSYLNEDALARLKVLLGLEIPMNNLHYWILGLPGQATDFTLTPQGYIYQILYNYHGKPWNITYKSYHEDRIPSLPDCIEIRQDHHLIKLKMNDWILS